MLPISQVHSIFNLAQIQGQNLITLGNGNHFALNGINKFIKVMNPLSKTFGIQIHVTSWKNEVASREGMLFHYKSNLPGKSISLAPSKNNS